MRVSGQIGGCVLALALASAGCDDPAPPAVARQGPALDSDDIAVMKGLLDTVVRPEGLIAIRRGGTPGPQSGPVDAHFLVVDTTLGVCERDRMAHPTPPGGCIGPEWIVFVGRALPTAMLAFETRNARRLPIEVSLGPDVTFISATVTDFVESEALLRQHPPGSAIVSFSAPVYPAPRRALIAYRVRHTRAVIGAARLERQHDGEWTLVTDGVRAGIEGTRN